MFRRLLLIGAVILLLTACAKPPVNTLQETRQVVAHAYAAGASRFAPEQYRIASEALHDAEQLIQAGDYAKARHRLDLAQRYAAQANAMTVAAKQEQREELRRQQLEKERAQREAEAARKRRVQREKAQAEKKPVAVKPKPKPSPEPEPPKEPLLLDEVEVTQGETLGSIAAREDVYDDILLWPLIYKANRDQIKDPREIFPGQILLIPRDKEPEEIEAARQEALELELF